MVLVEQPSHSFRMRRTEPWGKAWMSPEKFPDVELKIPPCGGDAANGEGGANWPTQALPGDYKRVGHSRRRREWAASAACAMGLPAADCLHWSNPRASTIRSLREVVVCQSGARRGSPGHHDTLNVASPKRRNPHSAKRDCI
jgi:hypothetical protein